MKNRFYRVSFRVHPAVWRYIDTSFPKKNGAYDMHKSTLYYLFTSITTKSGVRLPSQLCASYKNYVPIELYVTEFDFYHYGYISSEYQQCRLSRHVLHLILDEACRRVAMGKVALGIPVTKGIEHWLIDNGYEEDELTAENVRKIYNRRYKEYERKLNEYYRNAITDYGENGECRDDAHIVSTKKM